MISGGTKTNPWPGEWTSGQVEPVREDSFHSADYKSLKRVIDEFLSTRQSNRRSRTFFGESVDLAT